MTLNELKANDVAYIKQILHPDLALVSRILALGLIPGELIQVLNVAPMGCPLQVKVGGTFVSVRRSDATFIELSEEGK
ncbi:hypothetical protein PALB_9520 [Pseudoalteromonas luteoviolacea B = ATCC 29581]|nr:hypothetical protein PALB_9520 [Pseudoalteromonas luteoviolacea B = ATCC 29581]